MKINGFLKELKEYWIKNNIPNISETNAKFLRDLIKISRAKNWLEIWTANWYSAIHFWLEFKRNNGKLTTIEFSKNSYLIALENIKTVWLEDTVNLINWNALDEIPILKETYDFVFIDWMKRRSKDFLELVWDKVDSGWIIIIDDVIKFKEKMVWLYELLEKMKIQYNIIPIDEDDGIMMIVKN